MRNDDVTRRPIPIGVRRPMDEGLEKGGVNRPPTSAKPPGVPGATTPAQPTNQTSPTPRNSGR